ncbi:hypothetical protein HJC23_011551, partial [Cyclotella cryptica]
MYNGIGLSTVRGTATSGHVQRNAGHVRNSSRNHRSRTAGWFDGETSERNRGSASLLTAEALQDGASSLALHEKKRQLEVRLLELRDRLEQRGWDDSKIENEVGRERRQTLDRWAKEEEARKRLSHAGAGGGDQIESKSGEDNGEGAKVAHLESTRGYDDRGQGRFRQHSRHSESNRRGKGGKNAQQQRALQEERNEKLRDAFGISEKHHKEGAAFDRELIESKRREKQLRNEQTAKAERKAARQKIREEKHLAKLERREERRGKKRTDGVEKHGTKESGKIKRRSRSRSESSTSSSYSSRSRSSSSSSGSYSSSSSDEKYRGRSAGKKRGRSYSTSSSSSASYSSHSSYSSDSNGRSRRRNKKPNSRSSYSSHSDRASSPKASSRCLPPDSKSKENEVDTKPKR